MEKTFPNNTPSLIIFDMDGTMLDTEPAALAGWHWAITAMGYDKSLESLTPVFQRGIGANKDTFRRLYAEYLGTGFDFDTGEAMHQNHKDAHFEKHGIPIKPGLLPLLDRLDELNIKKCVATSTDIERATHNLKLANIINRFETIIGGNQVTHSKPHPEIFLKAAKTCNTAPENCLVLEDSAAGTEGAYRAGMPVIIIPDMLPPTEAMKQMAWKVCTDMHEVKELFNR